MCCSRVLDRPGASSALTLFACSSISRSLAMKSALSLVMPPKVRASRGDCSHASHAFAVTDWYRFGHVDCSVKVDILMEVRSWNASELSGRLKRRARRPARRIPPPSARTASHVRAIRARSGRGRGQLHGHPGLQPADQEIHRVGQGRRRRPQGIPAIRGRSAGDAEGRAHRKEARQGRGPGAARPEENQGRPELPAQVTPTCCAAAPRESQGARSVRSR